MNNGADGAAAAKLMALLAGSCIIWVIALALGVVCIIGMWKTFTKAGKPGWAVIIPIYNTIVLLEIVGKPLWVIILLLIPCVQFAVFLMLFIELAKKFGKSAGFGIGLFLLPSIFFPILGFGDAKYLGAASAAPAGPLA